MTDYNLGSTVTLASNTALSNVLSFSSQPSPHSGLQVPVGRAAPRGSHWEPPPLLTRSFSVSLPPRPKQGQEHALLKLSSYHTSYSSSLCLVSRTNLHHLHKHSISSLPSKHHTASQRHLKTKPLPTFSQCPAAQRGGKRTT